MGDQVSSGSIDSLQLVAPFEENNWQFAGDVSPGGDVLQFSKKNGGPGAVWAKVPVSSDNWEISATVRAIVDEAKEPGRSGLAFWYTSKILGDGPVHGSEDSWDGMALMLDSLGWSDDGHHTGPSGALRGHLNDGHSRFDTVEHAGHDAFGLCRINYRAMHGSPINLLVSYTGNDFIVQLNGQTCFKSDKISLPSGYYIGLSANSDKSSDHFVVDSISLSQRHLSKDAAEPATDVVSPQSIRADLHRQAAQHADAQAAAAAATPAVAAGKDYAEEIAMLASQIQLLQTSDSLAKSRIAALEQAMTQAHSEQEKLEKLLEQHESSNKLMQKSLDTFDSRMRQIDEVIKKTDGLREALDFSTDISDLRRKFDNINTDFNEHQGRFKAVSDTAYSASQHSLATLFLAILGTNLILFLLYKLFRSRRPKHYKII